METNTAQEKSTRVASSGEQNCLTRLTFSNPQQRSEHVQAFLEWLPPRHTQRGGVTKMGSG
jgi:hypothetical protein